MIKNREERVNYLLSIIEKEKPRVIAIDGRCASGKTTLAEDLSRRIDLVRIMMDDFFLPLELRTKERFNESGGNIHYERFIEEVINNLGKNEPFIYRRFSCSTMNYSSFVRVEPASLICIEGSYSLHPRFPKYWDVAFFLTVDKEEQLRRLEKRCPEKMDAFKTKWIPLEEEYFNKCKTIERADYIL